MAGGIYKCDFLAFVFGLISPYVLGNSAMFALRCQQKRLEWRVEWGDGVSGKLRGGESEKVGKWVSGKTEPRAHAERLG